MFRNPVYDLVVVVPALLIAALLGFLIMTSAAHAAGSSPLASDQVATSTGSRALTASTSGSTLPDFSQKIIIVTRAEAQTNDPWQDAAITPLSVRSASELRAYALQVLRTDANLAAISLSNEAIVATYSKTGRLLGFMPVAVPTKAIVRTDGSVSFSEPWYRAITMDAQDRMKTALEVRVHALLTSEGYLPSMQLAPITQAEILQMIQELVG